MTDDLIERALDTYSAINALKLPKSARLISTREGIEIHRRGLPTLILTHSNARRWGEETRSAEFD